MIKSLVQAKGLVKHYGERKVVDGVSIQAAEGEIIAIIGPNGAGKSTSMDMMLGLRKADAGTVTYWEENYRSQVGVQLQDTPFFPGMTVMQNLRMFAAFYGQKLSRQRSIELLAISGLQGMEKLEASRLSGGQQKRLAIALTLAHSPKLLFLDEPTAALDPRARRDIHELIRELSAKGTAIIFTSHDMEEVGKLADRILLIDKGKVAAEGTAGELLMQHQSETLEELYLNKTMGAVI